MKKYIQEKQKKKQNMVSNIPIKQRNSIVKKAMSVENVTIKKTICTPRKSVRFMYMLHKRNSPLSHKKQFSFNSLRMIRPPNCLLLQLLITQCNLLTMRKSINPAKTIKNPNCGMLCMQLIKE